MILNRLLASLFPVLAALACAAHAQSYVPGEIIVKLRGEPGSPDSYAFLGKASVEKSMDLKDSWGKMNLFHFALGKGQTVESALQDLRRDPNVLYAEPNYYVGKVNDAGAESETGVHQTFTASEVQEASVQAMEAYMATGANLGVQSIWSSGEPVPTVKPIVAVIDTGVDPSHSVFSGTAALWRNTAEVAGNGLDDDGNGYIDDVTGWNFVDNSPTMYDDDGHGTHVSGIILSIDQNIYTTPLRESKIRIMPLKFLNGSGMGTTSNAIRAIYYAVNNGASVLNNSWGGTTYSAALHEAVAYTYAKGALFVVAAGNSGTNNDSAPMYPASYDVPNVVAIAATTDYDYLASFSNFGRSSVHLGSPGVYILSTLPGNAFGTSSGTSMAAPFVAGTAAQIKVVSPSMLGYQMREILMSRFAQVSQLSNKVATGGRLDSSGAVTYAKTAPVSGSQPGYTLSYGGGRELASGMASGGGCGTVRALTSGEGPWDGAGAFVVIALLFLPIIVLITMRLLAPRNRRKHERFKINSDVRISVGDRELVGSISSISLGGVQVNTSALLQDGGLVSLTITSPSGDDKVEVAGRVVWSEANKAYGVAFDHTPQSVLSRIADWTRGLQKT
ncbi:MAG: S8 family serine peptidase [Bdellovibrionales bacterium]